MQKKLPGRCRALALALLVDAAWKFLVGDIVTRRERGNRDGDREKTEQVRVQLNRTSSVLREVGRQESGELEVVTKRHWVERCV